MVAVLLMLCVAAGIAYPFVQKSLALRRGEVLTGADTVSASSPDAIFPSATGISRPAREELCPSCSRLNPPDAPKCIECGAMMPVSGVGKLFGGIAQDDLIREGIQAGILLTLMLIAMGIASFLPIGGKITLVLLTIGALGYRFSRVIYN